jgi:hypothetical protein
VGNGGHDWKERRRMKLAINLAFNLTLIYIGLRLFINGAKP